MKEKKKAWIKFAYNDFTFEEIEITVDEANAFLEQLNEKPDLMACTKDLNVEDCSKRISHYIKMLRIAAALFAEDTGNERDRLRLTVIKKNLTEAMKAISSAEGTRYATVEDKVCRQMNQPKDMLTERVKEFFEVSRRNPKEAVNLSDGVFKYVIDGGYLSDRLINSGYVDEEAILHKELLKIAEIVYNVEVKE